MTKIAPINFVSNKKQNSPSILKPNEKNVKIPLSSFSDYWLENMAIPPDVSYGQLQISSICDARCEFCSNDYNEFITGRNKFRDVSEIEKHIWSTPFSYLEPFYLNESLPGRLSEGEALIHPNLFEILDVIRRKFHNNIIRFTTSGSQLSLEMMTKLQKYNPIQFTISLPTANQKYWTEIYKLKDKHYINAIESFKYYSSMGFSYNVNMTPMPSKVGWEDIENTIKFCSDHDVNHIHIFAPGYTKTASEELIKMMNLDKEELSNFFNKMVYKYPNVRIEWLADPNINLNISFEPIQNNLINLHRNKIMRSYWFTSGAAYVRFKQLMQGFTRSLPHYAEVIKVENLNYGGNIDSSGLWVIDDIRQKIQELNLQNQLIFLPGGFLDRYGFDLNGENINDYFKVSNNYITVI